MLRSVCFSNFVKFKEYHYLDFSNGSPSIFIGENGTGKSAVLEGIRRCLKPELSTSVSSIPDPKHVSYFKCNFENFDGENEFVLSGYVVLPDELENENTDSSGNNSTVKPESQELKSADEEQQESVPISGHNQAVEMNAMHQNDKTGNATNEQGNECSNRENASNTIVFAPDELENENTDSSGNNSTVKPESQELKSAYEEQQEAVPISDGIQEDEINEMHQNNTTGIAPNQNAFLYQVQNSADVEEQESVPISGHNQAVEMNAMHQNDKTGNATNEQGNECSNRVNASNTIVVAPDELENENTDLSGNNSTVKPESQELKSADEEQQEAVPISDRIQDDEINEMHQNNTTGIAPNQNAFLYQEQNSADVEEQESVPISGHNQAVEMNAMHQNDKTGNATNEQGNECSNRENASNTIVVAPDELENENTDSSGNNRTAERNIEPNSADTKPDANKQSVYKFVTKYSDTNEETLLYAGKRNRNGEFDEWRPLQTDQLKDLVKFFEGTHKHKNPKEQEEKIRKCLSRIFNNQNIDDSTYENRGSETEAETLIDFLSDQVVFTFPLHSIGPLQWSKSPLFRRDKREKNYSAAEKRCEVIKYFFKHGKDFDKNKENKYFKAITQQRNDVFVFKNNKVSTPNGKYGILKIPEGIYEAKIISVLLSSKCFKTIILEEPDRGMHPQFVNRMMQVINESTKDIEQSKENKRDTKRIILTTHNKALITPWSLPNCFVFRNIADKGDVKFCVFQAQTILGAPTPDNFRMKNLRQITSDHVSDIFFARKILFFEGVSEMLFFTELQQQILRGELKDKKCFESVQLEKTFSELTLVKMNGKGISKFCHDICKELKLEHLVLVDRNFIRQNTENMQDKADWFGRRKEELRKGNFFWIDGDIEDMVLKMTSDKPELLTKLEKENVKLKPSTPGQKRPKDEKLFLAEKVNLQNVKSAVKIITTHCTDTDDLYELIKELGKDHLFIQSG